MIVHGPIPDQLDLRLARDRLEIRMQDALLGLSGLVVSMPVALARRVEGLRKGGKALRTPLHAGWPSLRTFTYLGQEVLLLGGQVGILE